MHAQASRTAKQIEAKNRKIKQMELFIATVRGQMLKKQRLGSFNIQETEAHLDALEAEVDNLREERDALESVQQLQLTVIAAGAVA